MAPPSPKLAAIDLNLLVIFDAIMRDRSITLAGKRLGLSQPAASHALTRLRRTLKDELFIRTPKGMVPTPRAEQLAAPIREALNGFQHALEPTVFESANAAQTFRIAVDNYAAIVLVGASVARIVKNAPRITMDFRPSGTLDLAELLDRGEIDLAIGPFTGIGERFSHRSLLRDNFVAVLRKTHPAANAREFSIATFAALPHLEISSIHYASDFVDNELARRKLKRRSTLRAPFLSAVRILASSDMVSVLPRRIAEELIGYRPLAIRTLPHPSPVIDLAMIWPRWLDGQAAHRWVRDTIAEVANGVSARRPRAILGA